MNDVSNVITKKLYDSIPGWPDAWVKNWGSQEILFEWDGSMINGLDPSEAISEAVILGILEICGGNGNFAGVGNINMYNSKELAVEA